MKHLKLTLLLAVMAIGSAFGQAKKITDYPLLTVPLSGTDVVHMYEMEAAVGARSRQVTADQIKTFVLDGLETGLENGVSTILNGTSGYMLMNSGGLLSQKATTGSGSVVLANGGALVGPTITGGFTASGTILMNNATIAVYGPVATTSTPYATFAQEWDGEFVNFIGATSNIVGTNYDPDSAIEEWKFNSSRVFAIQPDGLNIYGSNKLKFDGVDAITRDVDALYLNGGVLAAYDDGHVSVGDFTMYADGAVRKGDGSAPFTIRGLYGDVTFAQFGDGALYSDKGISAQAMGVNNVAYGGFFRIGAINNQIWQHSYTAAQQFGVLNTWTSATNLEGLFVDWQSHANEVWINSDNGVDGGTVRPIVLATDNVERMRISAAGVVSVLDKLTISKTGAVDTGGGIEVVDDPANGSVRSLFLLPPSSGNRLYLGKAGQTFYAVNFSNVTNIENMPSIAFNDGLSVGGANNTAIWRTAGGTGIGANSPGDTGLDIFQKNTFDMPVAADLAARIHKTSGISFFGTNTDATTYERFSVFRNGSNDFWLSTQKGSVGGTARDMVLATDNTERVRIGAAGGVSIAGNASMSGGLITTNYAAAGNDAILYATAWSTPGLALRSNGVVGWTGTTLAYQTLETTITQPTVGVLQVNDVVNAALGSLRVKQVLEEGAPYNVGSVSGTQTLAYTNGKFQKMALTGTTTLAVPTGGAEGYVMRIFITASGAARDLSMNASIKIPDESLLVWPKTLTSGKTYIVQLQHNGTDWMLISIVGGY